MTTRFIEALLVLTLLGGCAAGIEDTSPILDGPPTEWYQGDLDDCRTLAMRQRHLDQETMAATVIGAAAGAIIGDLDDGGDALGGAVAGALIGGVSAAVDVVEKREDIVRQCLRGRGHRVVG